MREQTDRASRRLSACSKYHFLLSWRSRFCGGRNVETVSPRLTSQSAVLHDTIQATICASGTKPRARYLGEALSRSRMGKVG